MAALFSLLHGNISKMLKAKLRSKQGFAKAKKSKDIIWLLQTLDDIILNFDESKPKLLAIDDQLELVITLRQGSSTNEDFINLMTKEAKVYSKHGGSFLWGETHDLALKEQKEQAEQAYVKTNGTTWDSDEKEEAISLIKKELKEEILAMAIIKRTDKASHEPLQKSLANTYLLGKNEYPTTTADVLKVLNNYQHEHTLVFGASPTTPTASTPSGTGSGLVSSSGISFLQSNSHQVKYLKGANNSFFRNITCRFCGLKGHYQTHCPVVNSSGNPFGSGSSNSSNNQSSSSSTNGTSQGSSSSNGSQASPSSTPTQDVSLLHLSGLSFNQTDGAYLNPNWVLLDIESTDHVFCNSELLTDIKQVPHGKHLRLHTSGGSFDTFQKGKFGDFYVWHNSNSLANILSFALVTDQFRVTMDSIVLNGFNVHVSDSYALQFTWIRQGLCLLNATDLDHHKLRHAFSFLATVDHDKKL